MLLRVNLSVAVVAMTTNKTHHLANGTTVEVRIKRVKPKLKEKLQTNPALFSMERSGYTKTPTASFQMNTTDFTPLSGSVS